MITLIKIGDDTMRVDPKHLIKCELWKGSIFDSAHKGGWLSLELLRDNLKTLKKIEEKDKQTPLRLKI